MCIYMEKCIEIAKETDSNIWYPHVGVLVISSDGDIVGAGNKQKFEKTNIIIHAERAALYKAGKKAMGGYLFTTLEPCVETYEKGMFSSCSSMISDYKIGTVVFGLSDGAEKFNGNRGHRYLQRKGIEVVHLHEYSKRIHEELFRQTQDGKSIRQCLSRDKEQSGIAPQFH